MSGEFPAAVGREEIINKQGENMNRSEIYKCKECGMTFEVITGCSCPVSCCGKELQRMEPQTADWKTEKHVPYPETAGNGIRVSVGKDAVHPMTEQHHIEWIEVINGPYVNRRYLKPGEEPRADFYVPLQKGMIVREFCNLHGMWEFVVK